MRIAIVNDLALAREILRRLVLSVKGYSVAWTAADGAEAIRHAAADRPDAILMDLVMPGVNGVEATRVIMKQSPCPVLVVTATVKGHYDLVIRAMGAGALDAVETPGMGAGGVIQNSEPLLSRLARIADAANGIVGSGLHVALRLPGQAAERPQLVVMGASTGGPTALAAILADLPADFPAAILIAQHIAAEFAPSLVSSLQENCRLPVSIARQGTVPVAGAVMVAGSNDHLEIAPDHTLGYTPSPRGYPFRPSVDVLFASAASVWPRLGVGVLLTGMQSDGAEGLLRLREVGWHTIAQDEATSIVYGMPKAAMERGAAMEVLPLPKIAPAILSRVRGLKP
jgi:two-component system response regulator WspF